MKHAPFVLAVVAGLAGGCETLSAWIGDTVYGVSRTTPLAGSPDLACVARAIELTDGVASVSYHARHEGKGLFHPTPWIHDYVYSGGEGSGIWGSLQLIKTYDGHFTYKNAFLALHAPPPQRSIDAVRPVMRALEKNIAARCAIIELNAGVAETCTGVSCNPLPE